MPAEAEVAAEQKRRTADTGELRLQILGPLRIWRGSVELDAGPPQQAILFAVLLARAGRPTSTDELAWAIWGDQPPLSALNTIQKYVGTLRHLLEPGLAPRGNGSLLQRRGDAYVCAVGRGALDLIDFRSLVEAARHAQAEQRNEQALDDYVRALALWTGPAGTGLSKASNSTSVFVTLNAEFLDACAAAADLAMSLGEPERALPSLQVAAVMDPFHEPLHARLISALGASGQQAEALAVFRAVRSRLADELGLDPGDLLVAAERAVLNPPSPPLAGDVGSERGSNDRPRRDGLVGRMDELAMLWAVASSPLAGGTGLAMLEGEPGIGKTRLLEAICAKAERHEMLVLRGRCTEGDGTPALWPWIEIIAALLDGFPPAARESWLTGELHELIEPADGALTTAVLPDSGARFRLFERIVSALRKGSAQRPILLVMDDVQWADPASLQMFGHLADRIPRGMTMMGALRDRAPAPGPDLAKMLAGVSRSPTHRRVRLKALSPDEVVDLVHSEVGSALVPSVARSLHDRTAGNPFFVLELARLLVDSQGDQKHFTGQAGVPSTVLDVVRDRTVRLDEEARNMLQVAAVIGTELDIRILAQSSGMDEQTCLNRFQEVEELGVLAASSANPRVFRFTHDIVRESIIETTPRGRVPRMHLDVADALDRANAGDDAAVERVAYHLWSAGPLADPVRTTDALLRAGRAAAAKCAFESSERHLESAAQVARAAGLPQIELTALAQLTSAVGMSAGYVGAALGPLERAERLARDLGREREAADFLFSRCIAHAQGIQLDQAGRLALRLLDHGQASTDPVVRAYGWAAWGIHQWDVGHIGEAQQYLARVHATEIDDEPDRDGWQLRRDLRLLWPVWFAFTTALHGDVGAARTTLDELDAAAEDDPYAITVWATFSVVVAALAGDADWAAYAADRGISIDPDWSYGFLGSYQRLGRCWARAISGDSPVEMATQAAEIIVETMEHPPRSGLPTWYCLLAEMWLAADDLDEAERALDKVDQYLVTYGQRYAEGLMMLLRAQLMRARGLSSALVRTAAQRARELSEERGAHLFARRAEEFLAESRRGRSPHA
jgi:DNA-binding SARP family transcriptional activator